MIGAQGDIPAEVRAWMGRQLFDHVPSNIIVIDREFRVITANRNFVDVFGDAKGRRCFEVYKRLESPCADCMAAKTFEDGEARIRDESGIDKSGRPAHYVVHIAPVYNEVGRITHAIEMSYDVTEATALRWHYNLLFERVPCYVSVIDRDLKVVRANELLRRTFGDATGKHCYQILKQRNRKCAGCPAVKTFKDGGSYTSRQVGRSKDGDPAVFVVSTAPLARDGGDIEHVIEMAIDVTETTRLAEKLIREGEFRRKLTDSAIDAVLAADAAGVITLFNPAAERLFQARAKEVVGQTRASEFVQDRFLDALAGPKKTIIIPETEVRTRAHEVIPVRLSGTALREGAKVIGSAFFFQDLREYKRLEKEKLDNERLAAVGQTVAQLAHGIKNILTGLQGGMYVIKSGLKRGNTERTSKGWEMLERNVDRITELVKGFLSFSKGHVPDVRPSDLGEIARQVVDLYKDGAAAKGVDLRLRCDDVIGKAAVDPEDIRTCIENLVSNAIDACQVSAEKEQAVTIEIREEPEQFVIQVADTGCGMDYDIKSKVFTTFFTTKGLGGTGLGLMVTRKIVQGHGGRIDVESHPGAGSVFRIELPKSAGAGRRNGIESQA